MTFNPYIQAIGYVTIMLCSVAFLALATIGAAKLCNRAVWMVVDSCGGLKTLQEFRDWYAKKETK